MVLLVTVFPLFSIRYAPWIQSPGGTHINNTYVSIISLVGTPWYQSGTQFNFLIKSSLRLIWGTDSHYISATILTSCEIRV